MGKVVQLAIQKPNDSHLGGEARCLKCGHEWQAVVPVGTYLFDCPECGCDSAMKWAVLNEEPQWTCDCGCDLFRITPNRAYCINCGTPQSFGDLME